MGSVETTLEIEGKLGGKFNENTKGKMETKPVELGTAEFCAGPGRDGTQPGNEMNLSAGLPKGMGPMTMWRGLGFPGNPFGVTE